MPFTLKNKNLEVQIDHPLEGYNYSRFDWTGKITSLKFCGKDICGVEQLVGDDVKKLGRGLYNEFGIDNALGFEEVKQGDWFHKIGVGLLRKEDDKYLFSHNYEIDPANFEVIQSKKSITIKCESHNYNGYAYVLTKEIKLSENVISIFYTLENTGEKDIRTDEYCHNFICFENTKIDKPYSLKFPFALSTRNFDEIVNPESKVLIDGQSFTFNGNPERPFFFSNLSGGRDVAAEWEIKNSQFNFGVKEIGNFQTDKINLWGWGHVISPELFYKIYLQPVNSLHWSRRLTVFKF